jgi:hypothetical protein
MDDITVSIIFYIFVVLGVTLIDYNYTTCTNSILDSLLNGMLVNAIGIAGSELLMFIIPLVLKFIPFLNVIVDLILMGVPYISTIITGIFWALAASAYNVIISLTCSIEFLKYFKIIGLVGLTLFNFLFDKINFIKTLRKTGLKTLAKGIKNPKFRKKLMRKSARYMKNQGRDYVQNQAYDYVQNQAYDYLQNQGQDYVQNQAYNYSQNQGQDYVQNQAYNYPQNYNSYNNEYYN